MGRGATTPYGTGRPVCVSGLALSSVPAGARLVDTSARARHNSLKRYRPDDDPRVIEARRDLRAARAEDYIRKLVESAPPLTDEQRDRLTVLLHGGGA